MARERYTAHKGNRKVLVQEAKWGWDVVIVETLDGDKTSQSYRDTGSALTVLASALA